jgi:Putative cyclase
VPDQPSSAGTGPTDVDPIASECDNRRRWQDDRGRGTLHYITAEVAARAAAEVRHGEVVSLARPVHPIPLTGGPHAAAMSAVPAAVGHALLYTGFPPQAMTDLLTINTHHRTLTHLYALGHITTDDTVYTAVPLAEAVHDGRLEISDVTDLGPAIFTRGVLLDFVAANPLKRRHPISGEDLDHLARRHGVTLKSGDALVVRADPTSGAGIAASAVRWMHHHQVSVYLGDVSDLFPPPHHGPLALPLHQIGLARMGLPIVDGAHLDPLAAARADHDRHTFALALGPLPIHGATGSPITPLALFLIDAVRFARRE